MQYDKIEQFMEIKCNKSKLLLIFLKTKTPQTMLNAGKNSKKYIEKAFRFEKIVKLMLYLNDI